MKCIKYHYDFNTEILSNIEYVDSNTLTKFERANLNQAGYTRTLLKGSRTTVQSYRTLNSLMNDYRYDYKYNYNSPSGLIEQLCKFGFKENYLFKLICRNHE